MRIDRQPSERAGRLARRYHAMSAALKAVSRPVVAWNALSTADTPVRSPGDGARSDVDSPRLPLAPRTTRAVPTLILFDVSTARMSLARLESLRAVRRHIADGSGFAAVNRLRRLCQGASLITAAAESHCLAAPALRRVLSMCLSGS
jgi:hypothetical protein